jgi:membrane protein DedA with SNARE-associated domain
LRIIRCALLDGNWPRRRQLGVQRLILATWSTSQRWFWRLLLFVGYLTSIGVLAFGTSLLVIVAGACGGATILYWVARCGGRSLVHRYGRLVRIDRRHLDELKRLFNRFGPVGPGVARWVPGLRIYSSALAGLAEIPYPLFILNVLGAATLWAVVFLILGRAAGAYWRQYTSVTERAGLLGGIAVVGAVAAAVWYSRRRSKKQRGGSSATADSRSQGAATAGRRADRR